MRILNQEALSNALIFDDAVSVLKRGSHDEGRDLIKNYLLSIPIIVNSSLACELFLKSLLPIGTHGHLLYNDLFKKLDPDCQKIISDSVVLIMKENNSEYLDAHFINDLIENEDLFVQWRYFHEPDKTGIRFDAVFLNALLLTLKKVIVSAR